MKINNFSFKSKADGLEISAMEVVPDEEPKAVLQLVHGMCEYKERYLDFMKYMAGCGIVCVIHDHRGHGKSVESDDDLGYMYAGGYKGLIEDIRVMTLLAKEKYGTKIPFYLFGHSMGSLLVRCYIKTYDKDIDKLIVCGSPSKPAGSAAGAVLAGGAERILGGKKHLKLLDKLAIDMTYEKPFKEENLQHAWVNSDRKAVLAYNADPYCNYTFTVNGYKALIKATNETYSKKNWKMAKPSMPIALFSGSDDPCAINSTEFEKSAQFLRNLGYTDVRSKMYQGMRHEILNEPGKMEVYKDMELFLLGDK